MRIAVAGGTGTVGRYVVGAAEARGHEVVVLSRSRGVDVRTGAGLDLALEGANAIVDVTNARGADREAAAAFFTGVAGHLQAGGARHGAGHVVTLSIVGIDRAGAQAHGYYAAKLRHEQAALAGPAPATVLRATQFHEFAAQVLRWNRDGAVARVPDMRVQTVAARTVGEVLVELAEHAPAEQICELAGPEQADLLALVQAFVRRWVPQITVVADAAGSVFPALELLPSPGARIEGPPFEAWLGSDDAAAAAEVFAGVAAHS
jgi:uncharacterized protein YbjT (DUF2867 family)